MHNCHEFTPPSPNSAPRSPRLHHKPVNAFPNKDEEIHTQWLQIISKSIYIHTEQMLVLHVYTHWEQWWKTVNSRTNFFLEQWWKNWTEITYTALRATQSLGAAAKKTNWTEMTYTAFSPLMLKLTTGIQLSFSRLKTDGTPYTCVQAH